MAEALERDSLTAPGVEDTPTPDDEASPEPETDEDGEPGGADPQAVRARKEYRRRVKLQQDLQAEREQRISAEARAEALAEMRQAPAAPATPEKPAFQIFSDEQVSQAVEQGVITPVQASIYVAKRETHLAHEAAEKTRREEATRTQLQTAALQVEQKASQELDAYKKLYPTLTTGEHPRWGEIQAAYTDLRNRGLSDTLTTQALAVRLVLGTVETTTKQEETVRMARERQASDFHSEGGGGSEAGGKGNGGDPLAKVPQRYKDFWKSRGYTREEMIAEAKFIRPERMK